MKKYSVQVKAYKYGKLHGYLLFTDTEEIRAKNKFEAKDIARTFINSMNWAMDLTVYPDLRTLKEIR